MKICEIDDQDRLWAKLTGLELDTMQVASELDMIISLLGKGLGINRASMLTKTLLQHKVKLTRLLEANFANDETTKDLKDKCRYLIDQIDRNI